MTRAKGFVVIWSWQSLYATDKSDSMVSIQHGHMTKLTKLCLPQSKAEEDGQVAVDFRFAAAAVAGARASSISVVSLQPYNHIETRQRLGLRKRGREGCGTD